jgi:hypothetical protein
MRNFSPQSAASEAAESERTDSRRGPRLATPSFDLETEM